MKSDFLYLASQSPRRSQLLQQIGVRHETLWPDPDEDVEALEEALPGESPKTYVQRVTQLKWNAAIRRLKRRNLPVAPVLCADTTVALGRRIMGKPADPAQAREMLSALSGRAHRVYTVVAVGIPGSFQMACSESVVRFDHLTQSWIKQYVASGEPMGKAGAYAIQGLAATRIVSLRGSYSGIMGLPLYETAQLIERIVRLAWGAHNAAGGQPALQDQSCPNKSRV
ncbi:MAG: septum formation protein Maf [Pseudomonadota bacterium]